MRPESMDKKKWFQWTILIGAIAGIIAIFIPFLIHDQPPRVTATTTVPINIVPPTDTQAMIYSPSSTSTEPPPTDTPTITTSNFFVSALTDVSSVQPLVAVSSGTHISVHASGRGQYGTDSLQCGGSPWTDPDGNRYADDQTSTQCSPRYDDSNADVVPSLPIGTLLGRFGENGTWFKVGSNYSTTVPVTGGMFFVYNDSLWSDNSSGYNVTILISP